MPLLTVHHQQISWTPLLVLGYLFYLLLGAMVFQLLEKQAETHFRDQFQLEKLKFLQNYTCLDRQALEQFVQVRGTRSHYFGSSIILLRRNYTVLAEVSQAHSHTSLSIALLSFPSHELPKYANLLMHLHATLQ